MQYEEGGIDNFFMQYGKYDVLLFVIDLCVELIEELMVCLLWGKSMVCVLLGNLVGG